MAGSQATMTRIGRRAVVGLALLGLAACGASNSSAVVVATSGLPRATALQPTSTALPPTTETPTTTEAPTTTESPTTTEAPTTTQAERVWTMDEVKDALGRKRVWVDETGDRRCPGYDLPVPVIRTSDDNPNPPHFEVRVFASSSDAGRYFDEWVRMIGDSATTPVTCVRATETVWSAGTVEPNGDGSVTLGFRLSLAPTVRFTGVLHRCDNVVVQTVPASEPARLC